MSAITNWNRLEPLCRTNDLNRGVEARLADPLWLLARQWQFGELSGEDAGSPVESMLVVETAPIERFLAGEVGPSAAADAVDVDPALPLEVQVERRPVQGSASDARIRIDAGQHFLRLLSLHGAGSQRGRFVTDFRLDRVALGIDGAVVHAGDTSAMFALVGDAVPDGRTLAEQFLAHRGTAATLTTLPTGMVVAATMESAVIAAANDYLGWWETFVSEPAAPGAEWSPRRLEYHFAVQATMSDGPVVLRADDYHGGHLDWSAFDADSRADLGPAARPAGARTLVRRTLPTRAFYAGMPAERFWEFEDATVRFEGASVARTDLAHLLLDEFALSYGNDWYVVPMRLDVGTVNVVRDLKVRDTFGIETTVPRAASVGQSRWTMFDVTPRSNAAQRVRGLTVIPSVLGASLIGDPIEEVTWFRDEMANVVWAVEHRVESPLGGSVDRQRASSAPAIEQRVAVDTGDAELLYRLTSTVPTHWFPLVPVRPRGAPAGVVQLELRPIERIAADGSSNTALPAGRFLSATSPLVVEEEEIPRDGVVTTARWQLTRGRDGHYHLWLGHEVKVGHGEGSSGLAFDASRPLT